MGVADSYDGPRLMCHLNVDMHLPAGAVRLREFVTFRYDFNGRAGCSHRYLGSIELPRTPYTSGQELILYAGRVLTHVSGLPGYLDLRMVGVVCCALIGGAIGLLYAALTCRVRYRLLLCAALLAVVADATFIDFAVSPFSEIAAVIGLLYLLPGVALLVRPGAARRAGLAVVTAAGVFLVTAKTQDIVLAAPVIALMLAFAVPLRTRRERLRRLDRRARGRLLPGVAAVVLVACAAGASTRVDSFNDRLTKGNFVTAVLLPAGDDPAGDVRALGAPAWVAGLSGKPAWCTTHAQGTNSDYKRFLGDLSHTRIAAFLAARPARTLAVLDTVAEHFYSPRPDYTLCMASMPRMLTVKLGNHAAASGTAPGSLDNRFAPVTDTLTALSGSGFGPLAALWAVPVAAAALVLRRRAAGRDVAVMTLLASSVVAIQFAVCAFADGIDTSKHLNLAVFAFAASWATAAVAVLLSRPARDRLAMPRQVDEAQTAAVPASR